MENNIDLDEVSAAICSRSDEILSVLQSCKLNCTIPSVSAFEKKYSIKYSPPVNKLGDGDVNGLDTLELSEAFKKLDKIPMCFPKTTRKHLASQSFNKHHSAKRNETISSSNSTISNSTFVKSSSEDMGISPDVLKGFKHREKCEEMFKSVCSDPGIRHLKDGRQDVRHSMSSSIASNSSPSKFIVEDVGISSDRRFTECMSRNEEFERMLKSVTTEGLSARHQFKDNVHDMRRALEDLEKLVPRDLEGCKTMFTAKEDKAISDFKEEIDALLCMQENKDMFRVVEMPDDGDLDVISKLAGDLLQI